MGVLLLVRHGQASFGSDDYDVLSGHGFEQGAVAAQLLGLDTRSWIRLNRCIVNTSITKVVFGRSGRTLVSLNDQAHLEHDARLITYR
jgi:broad specificity phosphatase PhoE